MENVIRMLAAGETLSAKYRDHALTGNYSSYRECHITPDWLLIYEIREKELLLIFPEQARAAICFDTSSLDNNEGRFFVGSR